MKSEYCVVASQEETSRLLIIFPKATVSEMWKDGSMNILIPQDKEDDFVEYCEDNNIQADYIGQVREN